MNTVSSILWGFSYYYESSAMLLSGIGVLSVVTNSITPLIRAEMATFIDSKNVGSLFGGASLITQITTNLIGILYQTIYPLLAGGTYLALSSVLDLGSLATYITADFCKSANGESLLFKHVSE